VRRLILSILVLVLICTSFVIGFNWVTSHLQMQSSYVSPTLIDISWVETVNNMIENYNPCSNTTDPGVFLAYCRLYLAENGTENLVYYGNPDTLGGYLTDLLRRINVQKMSSVTEEFLDNVLVNGKVAIIDYRLSVIPQSQKFYAGYFILEDNLNGGLVGSIVMRARQTDALSVWGISE